LFAQLLSHFHDALPLPVLLQYTPLLPAVAVGTMEEGSIVEPVRKILAGKVRIIIIELYGSALMLWLNG
jgi:hypothetical protein